MYLSADANAQYRSVSLRHEHEIFSSLARTNSPYDSCMQPRFAPRARFCGALDWLCPYCGYINHCRIDRTGWRIRCKAKPCRRWFAYGILLHSLGSLQHAGRRRLTPPDITFPLATLDLKYQHGEAVHRLREDNCSDGTD